VQKVVFLISVLSSTVIQYGIADNNVQINVYNYPLRLSSVLQMT